MSPSTVLKPKMCFWSSFLMMMRSDVSLKIDDKIVVITGPNGGGKSTLAKVIAGIVKPTSGQILLDGEDITNCSVTERAKAGISLAFQQPVRFKGLTVRDLITIAAGHDLTIDEACAYLSEVGLCAKDYSVKIVGFRDTSGASEINSLVASINQCL